MGIDGTALQYTAHEYIAPNISLPLCLSIDVKSKGGIVPKYSTTGD